MGKIRFDKKNAREENDMLKYLTTDEQQQFISYENESNLANKNSNNSSIKKKKKEKKKKITAVNSCKETATPTPLMTEEGEEDIVLNSLFPVRPAYNCYPLLQMKLSIQLKFNSNFSAFETKRLATNYIITEPVNDYCMKLIFADTPIMSNMKGLKMTSSWENFIFNQHIGRVYIDLTNTTDQTYYLNKGITIAYLYLLPYNIK